jgi:transcriptional regulator PpsR
VKTFKSARKSLASLDSDAAARAVAAAADVALVVDARGVIRDSAFGSDELAAALPEDLGGAAWQDIVSPESRPKVAALLEEGRGEGSPRWRQLNHLAAAGPVPVLYRAVPAGGAGRVLAVGRDLRPMAALQHRLVEAEQSIERDYARVRHAEARYRQLFQIASEPVVIIEAESRRVVDANPAAARLLADAGRRLVGREFPDGFDAAGTAALNGLLGTVRATGRAGDLRVRTREGREFLVSASLFRQDDIAHVLLRLSPADGTGAAPPPRAQARVLELVERLPDGFVVTTPGGQVLGANRAFLDLAQLATLEQALDESLERWLGRPGVDLGVLLANLREHGSVRVHATTLRGEFGSTSEVEVAAVAVTDGPDPCLGFAVRDVGRRLATEARPARGLPRSAEQLAELVGRVPLKDLVRETTDVIERLCIEAALALTHDNRASAAEMLGLSRQSLYLKLRRYGLGDLDGTAADDR